MSKPSFPIIVFISGNGSNLQAIVDAIESGDVPAQIAAVISNQPDAYGLTRARQANIPTVVVNHRDYADRAQFDRALLDVVRRYAPKLIVLAGFMRILGREFVDAYPNQILNIHPSLLPKYPGLNTHQKVLDNGDKEHGVSIHYVTADLDAGPIVASESFTVAGDDTIDSLTEKVHAIEHRLYPSVIAQLAADDA